MNGEGLPLLKSRILLHVSKPTGSQNCLIQVFTDCYEGMQRCNKTATFCNDHGEGCMKIPISGCANMMGPEQVGIERCLPADQRFIPLKKLIPKCRRVVKVIGE